MTAALEHKQKKHIIVYSLILLCIGFISFNVYLILERVVVEQKNAAYVINLSGRQRMLSQFIVVSALEYKANPSIENSATLSKAITEMREAHTYLSTLPVISGELKAFYYDPNNLGVRLADYLLLAESILEKSNDNKLMDELKKRRHTLLASLEEIVYLYQQEAQRSTARQQQLHLLMLVLIFSLLLFKSFFVMLPAFNKLSFYFHLASEDSLTGSHNRRYFLQLLEEEHNRCLRYGNTYSLCVIDIDYFKQVNDTYGHPIGDKVIEKVAHIIEKVIRVNDKCGRIGGEEFAVLLVDADASEAHSVAEKLRTTIKNFEGYYEKNTIAVTISIGISTFPYSAERTDDTLTTDEVIKRADMALYMAKQAGRNQTRLWEKCHENNVCHEV